MDRRRIYQHICVFGYIGRIVPDMYGYAFGNKLICIRTGPHVRAGHFKAVQEGHLSQSAHAGAPDAYEVELFDIFQCYSFLHFTLALNLSGYTRTFYHCRCFLLNILSKIAQLHFPYMDIKKTARQRRLSVVSD